MTPEFFRFHEKLFGILLYLRISQLLGNKNGSWLPVWTRLFGPVLSIHSRPTLVMILASLAKFGRFG